jgi:OmcA/MtrC family decaheme c-type cytochrome
VNDERIARWEGATVDVPPVDLKVMIHKIHRGEDLEEPYTLWGFPAPSMTNPEGTPIAFDEVRYPNDLRECSTCHLPDTFGIPLADTVLPTRVERRTCLEDPAADGDSLCSTANFVLDSAWTLPPTGAVCTSCHDGTSTVAHAEIMTTAMGVESCVTCHGDGSAFDMASAHQRDP